MKARRRVSMVLLAVLTCVGFTMGATVDKTLVNLTPNASYTRLVIQVSGHFETDQDLIDYDWGGFIEPPEYLPGEPDQYSTTIILSDYLVLNGLIPFEEVVEVGWHAFPGGRCQATWWQDMSGALDRVYNPGVYVPWPPPTPPVWEIPHPLGAIDPLIVSEIEYALLDEPLPLGDLNADNPILAGLLVPLLPGSEVHVEPGETGTIDIPVPVEQGSVLVLKFTATGDGSHAAAVDYVQTIVGAESQAVPAVSGWPLIVLALLLLVAVSILLVRRGPAPA